MTDQVELSAGTIEYEDTWGRGPGDLAAERRDDGRLAVGGGDGPAVRKRRTAAGARPPRGSCARVAGQKSGAFEVHRLLSAEHSPPQRTRHNQGVAYDEDLANRV